MEGNTPTFEQWWKRTLSMWIGSQVRESGGRKVRRIQGQDGPHRPTELLHLGPSQLIFPILVPLAENQDFNTEPVGGIA